MKNKHHQEQEDTKRQADEAKVETMSEHGELSEEHKPEGTDKKTKGKGKEHELKQKYDELNDKYLRLYSDFDNYRKRTIKEKLDLHKTANEELIKELLSVVDDFERALDALSKHNADVETIKGVELIYNKMLKLLEQKGLTKMNAMGEEFNTDFHEAITNIPAPTPEKKGKVIDVIQNGYLLNGKIIRFAKVVVGS